MYWLNAGSRINPFSSNENNLLGDEQLLQGEFLDMVHQSCEPYILCSHVRGNNTLKNDGEQLIECADAHLCSTTFFAAIYLGSSTIIKFLLNVTSMGFK